MNDPRFALRQLARSPGFTAVAVLTLAIGIGACAAIFSVVDGVLMRPLPLPEPERVVTIHETFLPRVPRFAVSAGAYLEWKHQAATLADAGAMTGMSYNLTGQGDPARISALRMTASLLPTLRVQPVLGRGFSREDERIAGAEEVVILSHGAWQRRFGGRPDILGSSLQLNGRPFRIIGVMPRRSPLPERTELLAPASFGERGRASFGGHFLQVFARTRPGVSVQAAQAELAVIAERLGREHAPARGWGVTVEPLTEATVGEVRPVLLSLLAAVGFLLLITCANVAHLLLARATARAHEIAVRAALGASRQRLVRQLLIESLVLSLAGGLLGVAVARWGLEALLAVAPDGLPRVTEIAVDGRVLAFTLGLTVLTGVAFGLAPALQATRRPLGESLKRAGRGSGGGDRQRLRGLLVAGEVAVALVLLAGAGLLMRSFAQLHEVHPGFEARNALVASVHLPRPKYLSIDQYVTFARQAEEQLAALPGVQAVATTTNLPFADIGNSWGTRGVQVSGRPLPAGSEPPVANYYTVSPDYFRAMGIPLLRGRTFGAGDTSRTGRVALISESLARRFFPDQDPIGQRLAIGAVGGGQTGSEIVGVVGDVKPNRLEDRIALQAYEPFAQVPDNDMTFIVRARAPDPSLAAALPTAIARVDGDQPLHSVHPLTRLVGDSIARHRFAMILFAVFSGVALLLAAIGVYGVMAYSVDRRQAEIGIRMALGAQSGDVLRLILRQGGRLIAAGVAAGTVGALMLTHFLESLLFGIGARDPATFVTIAVVLAGVAGVACLLPARRASRLQPMAALRND